MSIRLLILTVLTFLSYTALVEAETEDKELIYISGFARLLEEETFLSDASIAVDVYDWNGDLQIAPKKIDSKIIHANDEGVFNTYVKKGRWFRLSLNQGLPPSIDKAMADWIQHALPGLEGFSSEFAWLFAQRNPDHGALLEYIAIDSGLMLADRDYVGRNREISFQVPLVITANVLKALGWGIYSIDQEESACQLVVTALSPKNRHGPFWSYLRNTTAIPKETCPAESYQPEVQNLFDCPHGASGVTFTSWPEPARIHYFGINKKCKTDVMATGLTETSRDGGAFLTNLTPLKSGFAGWVRGIQNDTELTERYFLCEPGRIINISPPHGPAGLKAENGYKPEGEGLSLSAGVGILVFIIDIIMSFLTTEKDKPPISPFYFNPG